MPTSGFDQALKAREAPAAKRLRYQTPVTAGLLALVVATTACGKSQPVGSAPDQKTSALIMVPKSPLTSGRPVAAFVGSEKLIDIRLTELVAGCALARATANTSLGTNMPSCLPPEARTDAEPWDETFEETSSPFGEFVELYCLANLAHTISLAVAPARIMKSRAEGGYNPAVTYFQVGDEEPAELTKFWSDRKLLDAPKTVTTVHEYAPPSSDQRATWALFAADMYREALLWGLHMLGDDECRPKLQQLRVDATLSFAEYVAAAVGDSAMVMEGAAADARRMVTASAAAKLSSGGDAQVNRIRSWRARFGSRLEAASVYVDVPLERWEGGAPLFTSDMRAATTYPSEEPSVTSSLAGDRELLAWIYPPFGKRPEGAVPLSIYAPQHPRRPGVAGRLYVPANNPPADLPASRLQGYVLPATQDLAGTDELIYLGNLFDREFVRSAAPVQEGTTSNERVLGRVFLSPNQIPGDYPVLTALRSTSADARAEELMRSSRLNPSLIDRSIDQLADDLFSALNADAGGAFDYLGSGERLLGALDMTRADLERAARRLLQEREVLGRPWIADPRDPKRLLGMGKSLAPVDPAYLYALTMGSFHPQWEIPGYVQRLPMAPQGEYARRGIFNALDMLVSTERALSEQRRAQVQEEDVLRGEAESLHQTIKVLRDRRALLLSNSPPRLSIDADIARHEQRIASIDQRLTGLLAQQIDGDVTRVLGSAARWARAYVGGRAYVEVRPEAPGSEQTESLRLSFVGMPYASALEAQNHLHLWLGEAGLACALEGQIGGIPCKDVCPQEQKNRADCIPIADHRFPRQGQTAAGVEWLNVQSGDWNVGESGFAVEVSREDSPTGRLDSAQTIYVVESGSDKTPRAVLGLRPFVHGVSLTRAVPLIGPGLRQALSETLAADPDEAQHGYMTCAGVAHDSKVKLGDELAPGSTENDVDQSFRYYLQQAKVASQEADELGEKLVEQGLQMDMRAEAARDELEGLCGGVVNIGRLASQQCDDCEISELLESAAESDPALSSELEGVKQCLGVAEGSEPASVALGDRTLCAWQYWDPSKPPLPLCSAGDNVLPDSLKNVRCPAIIAEGSDCTSVYGSLVNADTAEPATTTGFVYHQIDRTLGVIASSADQDPDPPAGEPTFACRDVVQLRKLIKGDPTAAPKSLLDAIVKIAQYSVTVRGLEGLDWLNQSGLESVGWGMAYKPHPFGLGELQYGGRQIARTGTPELGPSPDGYGCEPHPYVQNLLAIIGGSVNSAQTQEQIEAQREYDRICGDSDSLLCGQDCDAEDFDLAAYDRRLRAAVDALHMVSGGHGNSQVRTAWTLGGDDGIINADVYESFTQMGRVPSWLTSDDPGRGNLVADLFGQIGLPDIDIDAWNPPDYFRHRDLDVTCVPQAKGWGCWSTELTDTVGGDEDADFNPVFLWDDQVCRKGVFGAEYQGCGDMLSFLQGDDRDIRARLTRDPQCALPANLECRIELPPNPSEEDRAELQALADSDAAKARSCQGKRAFKRRRCFRALQKRKTASKMKEITDRMSAPTYETVKGAEVYDALDPAKAKTIAKLWGCRIAQKSPLSDLKRWSWKKDEKLTERVRRQFEDYKCRATESELGRDVPVEDVLDALDLACAVSDTTLPSCQTLLTEFPDFTRAGDLRVVRKFVQCAADLVEGSMERMYLEGLPGDVVSQLEKSALANTAPAARGAYAEAVNGILQSIFALKDGARSVVSGSRDLSAHLELTDSQLRALDLGMANQELAEIAARLDQNSINLTRAENALRTNQTITAQVTGCMTSVLSSMPSLSVGGSYGVKEVGFSASLGMSISPGAMMAANFGCKQGAAATSLEQAISGLQDAQFDVSSVKTDLTLEQIANSQQITEEDRQQVLSQFKLKYGELMDSIHQGQQAVQTAYAGIRAGMARLEAIRADAGKMAAKVLLLEQDDLGRVYNVNTAMRARMNTLLTRYETARQRAVRMTFLARRALEQKLGYDLSLMNEPVGWIDAPSTWADKLCVLSGIDYEKIRNPNDPSRATADGKPYDYAEEFIGDYVARLEEFVEAYRVSYPFQDGEDVAVISLRDELLGVRDVCEVEGPNLLRGTVDMSPAWWHSTRTPHGATTVAAPIDRSPFDCGSGLLSGSGACRPGMNPSAVSLATLADFHTATGGPTVPTGGLVASLCGEGCSDPWNQGRWYEWWATKPHQPPSGGWIEFDGSGYFYNRHAQEVVADHTSMVSFRIDSAVTAPLFSSRGTSEDWTGLLVGLDRGVPYAEFELAPGRLSAVAPLAPGIPHTVAFSVSGAARQLWVDGQLVAEDSGGAPAALEGFLGRDTFDDLNFSGAIGTFKYWRRGLSADELRAEFAHLEKSYVQPPAPFYQQAVQLSAGAYVLSWYQRASGETRLCSRTDPMRVQLAVPNEEAQALEDAVCLENEDFYTRPGWVRFYVPLEIDRPGMVSIGFAPPENGQSDAVIAAPQLQTERNLIYSEPSEYFATDDSTTRESAECADSDGDKFRSKYWAYGCEAYCPPGFGTDCVLGGNSGSLPRSCYFETSFQISQEAIEKGDIIQQGGIAKGNFNYRLSQLAVNVVGTGVKDCSGSKLPQGCYANNFLQYSLRHSGPFRVRNHDGDVYEAPLFPGQIQQQKAVVAERYVTNPISSADRNLLQDYWRSELVGRPMDGSYTLRIYETPDFNFRKLEDLQLVLRYRYWTRLD